VLYISLDNVQTSVAGSSSVFSTAKDMRDSVYISGTTSGALNNTLNIQSTKQVSVYAYNTGRGDVLSNDNGGIADATIVLPVASWGDNYYRLSYKAHTAPASANTPYYDYDIIIAKENGTNISDNGGTTSFATINAGQAYYRAFLQADKTGTHITADKPIAYFTHTSDVLLPSAQNNGNGGQPWLDILFEQMMPVNMWGKKFLVPNAYTTTETTINLGFTAVQTNIIRIIASEDNTTVDFDGATVMNATNFPGMPATNFGKNISTGGTLHKGEWVALNINGTVASNPACYINADKPVGVAAYMTGSVSGLNSTQTVRYGDPSIAWIPPLNQALSNVIISPFIFPFGTGSTYTHMAQTGATHYMIIIAPTAKKLDTKVNNSSNGPGATNGTISGLTNVNGGNLNVSTSWTDNAASGYSYYVWKFTKPTATSGTGLNDYNKSFKIENPAGVIVLAGGIADSESYYYNAGSGTCGVNP
jgi:hypothetical protein